jgi:hypothetical protein
MKLIADDIAATTDFWLSTNNMRLSPGKGVATFFGGHDGENCEVSTPNGQVIRAASEFKILGLTIDNKLSFGQHADNIVEKPMKRLCCLRRVARRAALRSHDLKAQNLLPGTR